MEVTDDSRINMGENPYCWEPEKPWKIYRQTRTTHGVNAGDENKDNVRCIGKME